MSVARTIWEQLGGSVFTTMTGANRFVGAEKALAFRLPGGAGFAKNGINHVRVVLDASDTYTMVFSRIRGEHIAVIEAVSDVYADSLQSVFTRVTGLETHL